MKIKPGSYVGFRPTYDGVHRVDHGIVLSVHNAMYVVQHDEARVYWFNDGMTSIHYISYLTHMPAVTP